MSLSCLELIAQFCSVLQDSKTAESLERVASLFGSQEDN